MNPIFFAMRHPVTMVMVVVALVGGGGLAAYSMKVNIFPPVDLPKIYILQNYNGMSPAQIEGLIVNQFELNLQYVDGVQRVESRSIQQVAMIEVSFLPNTDMAQAMAQVVAQVNRAQATMPEGVLPPQIMRMDAGSVPIGYLVMTGRGHSLGELADLAQQRVRPLIQSEVPGTVGTAPFGSNVRSVVINVNPDRLRAYNLTPDDVVKAMVAGNAIVPAGNLYVKDEMPLVPNNAMVPDVEGFLRIPVVPGRNVYLRDVATVADATDLNYGYAMVDGQRAVYIPVVQKGSSSALTVVHDIRKSMPLFQSVLPEGVTIRYEFDESPAVVQAIRSVATEGAIGAVLTGLTILLFLGDWRSMLVVVFNIPMALLGSMFALWVTGNTTNIMTLGGLALSIGMLVDEGTVCIENIHVQMERTNSLARAVERGTLETAVPRLLAMLCILSVFIPAFIMAEPVKSLFVPLALAVGFSMITSFMLSSTLVPVLSVWLLKPKGGQKGDHDNREQDRPGKDKSEGLFGRVRNAFDKAVGFVVNWRWVAIPAYLILCALVCGLIGPRLGTELFPAAEQGKFALRFRMPPGTNFELTRQTWLQCLRVIEDEAGSPGNVTISMGFAGQQAPNYGMNNMLLFMRGPDDGQMRVALDPGSGLHVDAFREKLRTALPQKIVPWYTELLKGEGLDPAEAAKKARQITFAFEPGDIVSAVMSFGAPAPIEVVVACHDLSDSREYCDRLLAELRQITCLRDVTIQQSLDYPTVPLTIDREKAGLSGLTAKEVGRSVLEATNSSRMVVRNYWQDPHSGQSYQVQVQVPTPRMTSADQVRTIPLNKTSSDLNLLVRDVARVGRGSMPGEYDRTSMMRYLSVTANVEGEDLGRAADQVAEAMTRTGQPPAQVHIQVRGQIKPMNEMFRSLGIGLAVAVFVILVLLTGYFQSPRLALISISAVPGVLSGVVLVLYLTNTTLNIESFMGAIMSVGVSVSNSVMLVTFASRDWQAGKSARDAAVTGATERLRPILMTACAMTIGMVPMALALEAGSEMEAPLGRAVIGGLVCSTFATLLLLPGAFALILGDSKWRPPSVDPNDPDSLHHDEEGKKENRPGDRRGQPAPPGDAPPAAPPHHDDHGPNPPGGSQ
jgi:multidrug efflux pump subunit AcrB